MKLVTKYINNVYYGIIKKIVFYFVEKKLGVFEWINLTLFINLFIINTIIC